MSHASAPPRLGDEMRADPVVLDLRAHGFFGKIPSRGDFVRAGLPTSFVEPWDMWMSGAIAASRETLGERWRVAWMEAPIWCFALAAGVCGPEAVIGLWMPSVDRAGRDYALALAAVVPDETPTALAASGAGFLREVEAAGLAALSDDLTPDALAGLVAGAACAAPAGAQAAAGLAGRSLWWTDGAPLVPACAFALGTLPDDADFARMLMRDARR